MCQWTTGPLPATHKKPECPSLRPEQARIACTRRLERESFPSVVYTRLAAVQGATRQCGCHGITLLHPLSLATGTRHSPRSPRLKKPQSPLAADRVAVTHSDRRVEQGQCLVRLGLLRTDQDHRSGQTGMAVCETSAGPLLAYSSFVPSATSRLPLRETDMTPSAALAGCLQAAI